MPSKWTRLPCEMLSLCRPSRSWLQPSGCCRGDSYQGRRVNHIPTRCPHCMVPVLLQDKNQPFTDLRLLTDDNNLLQSTALGACHAWWASSTSFYRGGNWDFEKSPNLYKDVAKKWRQDLFQIICFQVPCSAHASTPHLPCWSDFSSLQFLQWAFSEPLQPFLPWGCVECDGVCSWLLSQPYKLLSPPAL